ncbi:mitogen-activated protein kinase 8 [Zea mays]|uniref:mitogen-activated protein kinase 8 n=1 Tax=Zea mays TaxID=4577 RepID=UPI0009AAD581|nr:mitogen-activated protein kinase 8-like [Zea mays]|eukprot:XP_020395290.1 mitogen-activated protein kinase 8-like [Zea mays]
MSRTLPVLIASHAAESCDQVKAIINCFFLYLFIINNFVEWWVLAGCFLGAMYEQSCNFDTTKPSGIYSPAIDMWSIGCIFAEILTGKPLFPGKNVVHQLDLMTDLLGTPSTDTISQIRNEKTRRYLSSMRRKQPIPFSEKFPNADHSALKLLQRLLAFDPKDRPTAEEVGFS